MTLPRSKYVQEDQEGVYHCFNRCVRRAFLYGYDALTRRDFSHRKAWLVNRLRHLAAIFAIDVCAYSVMDNHYHTILRTRPDIVASWSDHQVASRWLTLFPKCRPNKHAAVPVELQIHTLAQCPKRIATLRKRLSSLSWFNARLNEFIARAANKEDHVKGRFWESRFKCQRLLDEAAIAACMVYVDLNPVRAGLVATPEESNFTSIQERIRAWQNETLSTDSVSTKTGQNIHSHSPHENMPIPQRISKHNNSRDEHDPVTNDSLKNPASSALWLCPIASESHRRGILPMTAPEYFVLVDKSGRIARSQNQQAIDSDIAPLLQRISANPQAWPHTISHFGSRFHLAAGLLSNLRNFADKLGKRWLNGVSSARSAFSPSPPQSA